MKKLLRILAGIWLATAMTTGYGTSAGEGITLQEQALEIAGSSLRFPMVSGIADAELAARVNARILEDLQADAYRQRVVDLISDDGRSITVTWTGGVRGDVFSAALEAEGAVRPPRVTHAWTWSNVDLQDGHEITLDELFPDPEGARKWIEGYLEEEVAPTLIANPGNSALTPLPEGFLMEGTGLTLLYGADQLSTLHDRAGAVKIGWNELREITDPSEDGIPARIGAAEMTTIGPESAQRLREMTEGGQLPDIPVKLGERVQEWTDRQHLLNDPDEYAGGRMFSLEGAAFRDVYILSDAVSADWAESRVQGIRTDRGCIFGLCIGETTADEWHRLLGEADSTVTLDAESAEAYRTVPGTRDYYLFGDRRLQLQADEDGVLRSIILSD